MFRDRCSLAASSHDFDSSVKWTSNGTWQKHGRGWNSKTACSRSHRMRTCRGRCNKTATTQDYSTQQKSFCFYETFLMTKYCKTFTREIEHFINLMVTCRVYTAYKCSSQTASNQDLQDPAFCAMIVMLLINFRKNLQDASYQLSLAKNQDYFTSSD